MDSFPFALPSVKRLKGLCGPAARNVMLEIVAETGSTNADLLARAAQQELARPTLLWAQSQTAGRGRAGRSWLSSPGATLTFSLAWPFTLPPQGLVALSLAVGVTVAGALAASGIDVRLKWPNDILRNGDKLAGILIETAVDRRRGTIWAVIGIGINLVQSAALSARIGRTVADAAELDSDRERLMANLLTALAETWPRFAQQGFAAFADAWNRRDAYAGVAVNIVDQGKVLQQGTARGVDAGGCLQLDTERGRVAIAVGDVSLRIRE